MTTIGANGYDVYVGNDVFSHLENLIQTDYSTSEIFVLVDENTLEHCWPKLLNGCPSLKDAELLEIESGEENKSLDTVAQLWSVLTEFKVKRSALFINLGGGVICDMGGFVASCYKRGLDFIHIPTTLLSAVDASVGGKLGFDFNGYKNQIGLINIPKVLYVNPVFLDTLPKEEIVAGYAEILKHGLILDAKYWDTIMASSLDSEADVERLIIDSIHLKNNVVIEDPREKGKRKLLNFGHTIGHAVESYLLDKGVNIRHGEAVAVGMICELYICSKTLNLSQEELNSTTSFIAKRFPKFNWDKQENKPIIELMYQDKKNDDAKINFSLIDKIGSGNINQYPELELIEEALDYYLDNF